jgi:hypothetical protein
MVWKIGAEISSLVPFSKWPQVAWSFKGRSSKGNEGVRPLSSSDVAITARTAMIHSYQVAIYTWS